MWATAEQVVSTLQQQTNVLPLRLLLSRASQSVCGLGDHSGGVRLAEAAEAELDRLHLSVQINFWNQLQERYLGAARESLGPEAAQQAEEQGRALSLKDACALAHQIADAGGPRTS